MYVYLYENKRGNRKIDVSCTICPFSGSEYKESELLKFLKTNNTYCEIIYPWLNGRDFADIPTWFDINKQDAGRQIKDLYKRYFKKLK